MKGGCCGGGFHEVGCREVGAIKGVAMKQHLSDNKWEVRILLECILVNKKVINIVLLRCMEGRVEFACM